MKPSHGRKILKNQQDAGFSPKAAYIFKKQLEEADFIILNRVDELEANQVNELSELIAREYPNVPLIRMSAKSGAGFESLLEVLDQKGQFGRRILELDYDIYAAGEAELGWLNSSVQVTADAPFSLDALLIDVVERLRKSLAATSSEPAHLKAIGMWEGYYGVANLISSDTPPNLSLASECETRKADVIVNARVAIDPQELEKQVQAAMRAACQDAKATAEFRQTQSFRPGRPVPTHRYAAAD
jgi:hypothetical protein